MEGLIIRKKSKLLLLRSIDSLRISIELFNRPFDLGRTEGVLLMLHHAFEMLVKAIIYQKTGKIREKGEHYNYTFRTCVYKLKDPLHAINDNQIMTLNTLDELRDCAMHDTIILSEDALYLHAQSAVTLFDDLISTEFDYKLNDFFPERVLPISTHPPSSIIAFLDKEFSYIYELISPGKRSKTEAISRLRPLIVMENNLSDSHTSTADYEVSKIVHKLGQGISWKELFPGVANLVMDSSGGGMTYSVRLTKGEGLPVRQLREGEDPEGAILYREVNLIDRYPFGAKNLDEKLGINNMRTTLAIIEELEIQNKPEYFKLFKIGSAEHKRYSNKGLIYIREKLSEVNLDEARDRYKRKHYGKR